MLLALPLIPAALAAMWRLGWRGVAAAVGIGAGASAIATILFTQAFVDGDPVTPVVIQKVQPLVALVAARLLLGERPRQRFAWYFVPAIVGTWLMAFPHPTSIDTNSTLLPSLYALARGRALGVRHRPRALPRARPEVRARDDAALHVRARPRARSRCSSSARRPSRRRTTRSGSRCSRSSPGALALSLYYYGLRKTPAVAATLAELAFPVTAILVGYFKFGATLDGRRSGSGSRSRASSSRCCLPVRATRSSVPPARACAGVITICDVGPRDGLQNEPDVSRRPSEPSSSRASPRRTCRGSRQSRSCATSACRRWPARKRSLPRADRRESELSRARAERARLRAVRADRPRTRQLHACGDRVVQPAERQRVARRSARARARDPRARRRAVDRDDLVCVRLPVRGRGRPGGRRGPVRAARRCGRARPRRHDRRRDAAAACGGSSSASRSSASRSARTSTTRATRATRPRGRRSTAAPRRSTHPSAGSAAARSPRTRPATSRPRISSGSSSATASDGRRSRCRRRGVALARPGCSAGALEGQLYRAARWPA